MMLVAAAFLVAALIMGLGVMGYLLALAADAVERAG